MGCLAQCFGPVSQLTENSKYYSAKPPQRLRTSVLPHITIQCPVYKEGLQGVIVPTIKSIKQAICTYELQGGTANIFINDDGLQLFKGKDEHLRKERIDFYADHNIGWVARPGHGSEGFVRKGKFKKVCSCEILFLIAQVSFLRSALWRGWRDVELRWFWFFSPVFPFPCFFALSCMESCGFAVSVLSDIFGCLGGQPYPYRPHISFSGP